MKSLSLQVKEYLLRPKQSKLFLTVVPFFKEKRAQQFTSLSLTFITIAFFSLFAIGPTLSTITDLQKQVDDNTFVNQQLQIKIQNLTNLQSQYSKLQPQLDQVMAVLPTTPAIDIFVGQLHQLALQVPIQLTRVQTLPVDITPSTTAISYAAYSFSIEGQGDLPLLQKYVASLTTFNRLISFDSIEYTRVGNIASTFRVTIRGKAYFKPGPIL